jgi:hypothetical protein
MEKNWGNEPSLTTLTGQNIRKNNNETVKNGSKINQKKLEFVYIASNKKLVSRLSRRGMTESFDAVFKRKLADESGFQVGSFDDKNPRSQTHAAVCLLLTGLS